MKSRIGSRAWLIWTGALFVVGAALIGCGGDGTTAGEVDTGDVGSVDVNLFMNLDASVLVNAVDWSISHPDPGNEYDESGQVDTSTNDAEFHLEVTRIPVDTGYVLTLDAIGLDASDGTTEVADCTISATFDITLGGITQVIVEPVCTFRPGATGAVEITGNSADFCPEIEQVVVSQTENGTGFNVSVTATDDDGDPITYAWSTSNGGFDDEFAASTIHECASAGTDETITISVSPTTPNGCAADDETITVDCAGAYTGP